MIEILHPVADADRVRALTAPSSGLRFVDGWDIALPELMRVDHPRLPSDSAELADLVAAARGSGVDGAECRYVVFPWRDTIVKLPDSRTYWRLRTARNRYLVDDGEQRRWSSALIAVAGLSVGAAALAACSLTGARRFRLAEHDTLGPTNLNRLQGSVCDLGTPKLVLAQRRTLEIDPYSEISGFADGYSPSAAEAFLGGAERPAVVLEEMDDLAMKVDLRIRARAAGIPVVMVTDNGDNAVLDVERYDLDRDYPLFHGRAGQVEHLSAAELADPRRRQALVAAIVGSDITPRTRYSMLEVGRTLPSWPQLGTAVTLAGSLAAFAARSIVCGAPVRSGRYRVESDTLLLGDAARGAARWNEMSEAAFRAALPPLA